MPGVVPESVLVLPKCFGMRAETTEVGGRRGFSKDLRIAAVNQSLSRQFCLSVRILVSGSYEVWFLKSDKELHRLPIP